MSMPIAIAISNSSSTPGSTIMLGSLGRREPGRRSRPASISSTKVPPILVCAMTCAATIALGTSSRVALAASKVGAATPMEGQGNASPGRAGILSMRAVPAPGPSAERSVCSESGGCAKHSIFLADNVVVAPTPPQQSAPAPAPAVATVNSPAPPTSSTVVETPRSNKVVHVDVSQPHNYMTTIAVSALMGAVAGGLVGGAVYFIGDRNHAQNIAYWAAGGVLVGAGVGLVQILAEESRASEATALRKLPADPAPTLRLALLRTHF